MILPDPRTARRLGLWNILLSSLLIVACNLYTGIQYAIAPIASRMLERADRRLRALEARGARQLAEAEKKASASTDPAEKARLDADVDRLKGKTPKVRVSMSMGYDMIDDPRIRAFGLADLTLSIALNATMLLGGVGLIHLRPWGRKASLLAASAKIVVAILYAAGSILWIVPIQMAKMMASMGPAFDQAKAQPGGFPLTPQLMMAMSYAGILIYALVLMIYPVIVLVLLNRAAVRAAFAGGPAGPAGVAP